MPWIVEFAEEFEPEFDALPEEVQDALLAKVVLLEREGPRLGRPHADTLEGSRARQHEGAALYGGGWCRRIAFAFDPYRAAILLVGRRQVGRQPEAVLSTAYSEGGREI